MVYCPHCGTPNKPNSKFCKNCAALLAPSTDVRCPICGTMNAQGAATCQNCGTRLTTGSVGAVNSPDQLTPADSPEQIAPFNPPPLPPENSEPEAPEPPPVNRPSFARANSEWLRRIQKTPPPAENRAPAPESPAPLAPEIADTPAPESADVAPQADTFAPAASETRVPLETTDLTSAQEFSGVAPEAADAASSRDAGTDWLHALDAHAEPTSQVESVTSLPEETASTAEPFGDDTHAAASAELFAEDTHVSASSEPSEDVTQGIKSVESGAESASEPAQEKTGAVQVPPTVEQVAPAHHLPGLDLAVLAMAAPAPLDEPTAEPFAANRAFPAESVPAHPGMLQAQPVVSEPPSESEPAPSVPLEPEPPGETPVLTESETMASEAVMPVETPPPAPVEPPPAPVEPPPAPVEAPPLAPAGPPPVKPVLSEIKLTRDDYDYSDIGGEVTDEMKAQLDAGAAQLSSTEDEVALARRLLGLDVEGAGEPSAKPVLSEIKLTGDDYDYSDIGGEVTDEMKAQLDARAAELASMEDEVALARRLLGLDTGGEPTPPPSPTATKPAPPAQEEPSPAWLTALAAASSAAVAGDASQDRTAEPIPETSPGPIASTESAETPSGEAVTPPPLAEGPANTEPPPQIPVPGKIAAPGMGDLEGGELPDWLREIAPREFTPQEIVARHASSDIPEEAEADVTDAASAQAEMPAWVQALAPDTGGAPASTLYTRLPDLNEGERGDLPDWLREPPPAPEKPAEPEPAGAPLPVQEQAQETDASQTKPAASPRTRERVRALDLPSWMTDAMPGTGPGHDPFEPIETTGPLAGVSGILPLAIAITEPHTLTSTTPTRSDGGRIFQTIVAEPLAAASSVPTAAAAGGILSGKHLIYLVIFLAALVPLFLPLNNAGLGLDATSSPSADFYDQMQAVPENGTVLLAFDYTPGQAVELAPAARVIVNSLAARHVNVIAVSTGETGATLARDVLTRAAGSNPGFTFVNVGYIFGREARLSEFAKGWLPANQALADGGTWGASPLARSVQGMNDLGLAILFTADENDLRMWMEQAGPHVTLPIVAATSAGLEPQASNYVNSGQLRGYLRGLTGAAELELLTNTTGQAVKTVDALSFVSLALVGIIIVANLMGLFQRGKKRDK